MCECHSKINENLRSDGHRLPAAFTIKNGGLEDFLIIPLVRTDGGGYETRRKKTSSMAVNYCPWCGEKLRKDKREELQAREGA